MGWFRTLWRRWLGFPPEPAAAPELPDYAADLERKAQEQADRISEVRSREIEMDETLRMHLDDFTHLVEPNGDDADAD